MAVDSVMPLKWWIPGPGDDESLRSIVERAARLYGVSGSDFRDRLTRRAIPFSAPSSGLDALSVSEIVAMARMIGMDSRALYAHRLIDHPLLVMESERRAFCPLCWRTDEEQGRPRTFRRAWAGVFTLSCPEHKIPLHWSVPLNSGCADRDVAALLPQGIPEQRILRLIDTFSRVLGSALTGEMSWPPRWRGNAHRARAMLLRCSVNLGCMLEHRLISSISVPPGLMDFIAVPRHRVEPLQESPWECVRAMGPPSWRRAALWMTAWYVIPDLARYYRPPGLPCGPFAAIDEQWVGQAPRKDMRRIQRYRRAIIDMCTVFPLEKW